MCRSFVYVVYFRVMHEGKEVEEEEEKGRRRRTIKSNFSYSIFSNVRKINGTLSVYFTLE